MTHDPVRSEGALARVDYEPAFSPKVPATTGEATRSAEALPARWQQFPHRVRTVCLRSSTRSRLELVPLLHYTSVVNPENAAAAARLRLAFDLFEAGEAMMRASLRRRNPEASAQWIEAELQRWLLQRPGAEHGDGIGVPGCWPRKLQ
jgi:hypothetical protein